MYKINASERLLEAVTITPGASKMSCEIDSCDIGSYMKVRNISDSVKFRLLKNHFKPGPTYCFPRFATGRRFQHKWLHQFTPWLVYSEVAKGGFCLPCALFASSIKGVDPGVLVTRPLINLTKALEILGKHKEKQYHLTAITKCVEFQLGLLHELLCKNHRWSWNKKQNEAFNITIVHYDPSKPIA